MTTPAPTEFNPARIIAASFAPSSTTASEAVRTIRVLNPLTLTTEAAAGEAARALAFIRTTTEQEKSEKAEGEKPAGPTHFIPTKNFLTGKPAMMVVLSPEQRLKFDLLRISPEVKSSQQALDAAFKNSCKNVGITPPKIV